MSARSSIGAAQLDRALGDWQQGREAAYRALAGRLRTLVLDGRVPVETRLPAERELCAVLGVSRTTVTAAYELLREEGFLASRRGSGSWTALPVGHPMPVAGLSPFPTDRGVIDLGTAALSAAEPWISRAMASACAELPAYARTHGHVPAGLQVLREAVAERFAQRGLPTTPEQIMITSGAAGAFTLLLRALVGPADRIAVESPSYANSLQAIRFHGGRPVPVPFEQDSWSMDAWGRALREAAPALAYLVPDFHNPTGLLMPNEQRRELVALARATGTRLIVDETMVELSLDDSVPMPLPVAAYDRSGSVITIGSAGKTFWGGLRIGWIRAAPDLIRRLAGDRASMDVCSPVMEQLAVRHLLGECLPEVLAHQRQRVREQRDALVAAVREELPDWTFRVPDGGLSLWVRTEDGGLGGSALAAMAAQSFGVWIGSGPRFGVDGVLERFVRLPFAQPVEVSREAVRRLAAARAAGAGAPPPAEFALL